VCYGSYTGNGIDDRSITGCGFQPHLVILKNQANGFRAVFSHSGLTDQTLYFDISDASFSNCIQAMEPSGFQVGNYSPCNGDGYTYHYIAFRDNGKDDFTVGSYVGDGLDNRNIVISSTTITGSQDFQPDIVFVRPIGTAAEAVVVRFSTLTGDNTCVLFGTNGPCGRTDRIQSININGFQVGTNASVNSSGVTYHYFAFKNVNGALAVGSFVGNGSDNRNITGIGFQPIFGILRNVTSGTSTAWVYRFPTLSGDASFQGGSTTLADFIQSFLSDGFQVGTQASVNASGSTINYFMVGQPPETPTRRIIVIGRQ
jgi:hypothetical protein